MGQIVTKFLCLDGDTSFCDTLKRLSPVFHFSVSCLASESELLNALDQQPCSGCFVEESLLTTAVKDKLTLIKKKPPHYSIILASLKRIDSATLKRLLTKHGIDYVVEKPLSDSEWLRLLQLLFKERNPAAIPAKQEEADEAIVALKASYQQSIFDKIGRFEGLVAEVEKNFSRDTLDQLKKESHKIAGSAGIYGYPAVTAICRELEIELALLIEGKKSISKANLSREFTHFLKSLKFNFQIP